jgi:hypothetical protein
MDMLRRVLAAIIYETGVCVVLYVAYFLPYINHPEDDKSKSMSAVNNWALSRQTRSIDRGSEPR